MLKCTMAALLTAVFLAPLGANAATILSIDGPPGLSPVIGENSTERGAAQSFTVSEDVVNASFNFDILCFACAGDLWLIRGEMSSTATIFQRFAETTFNGFSAAQSALSGLTLEAGELYTLIMAVDTGNALWRATDAPVLSGTGSVTPVSSHEVLTGIDQNFLPWSPTSTTDGSTLIFSIEGDVVPPTTVPLPASAAFLLAGLIGFGALRLRRAY